MYLGVGEDDESDNLHESVGQEPDLQVALLQVSVCLHDYQVRNAEDHAQDHISWLAVSLDCRAILAMLRIAGAREENLKHCQDGLQALED